MPQPVLGAVLEFLQKVRTSKELHDLADGELLGRFLSDREDAAFSVLVHRHGPMVLGVCRRVLGDCHSAEDAFQATFMILVRRAGSIRRQAPLSCWLHGVAKRVALKARAKAAMRRSREQELRNLPRTEPIDDVTWQELRQVLDEEINLLPEKCRAPLVLCYFERKTMEQAAKELGWPKSSLASRLARARELLRRQLTKRGIVLSAGALAAALTEKTAPAAVGAMLTINTVKAAASVAAGKIAAGAMLSAQAIALMEEAMLTIGIKSKALVIVLMLGLAVGGGTFAGFGAWSDSPLPTLAETMANAALPAPPREQENEAEKLFFAMEKQIREAKSVKVKWQSEIVVNAMTITAKGSCLFSENNQAHIEAVAQVPDKVLQKAIISNGKQVSFRESDEPKSLPISTPARFGTMTRTVFARLGGFLTVMMIDSRSVIDFGDVDSEMRLGDFKLIGKEQIDKRETLIVECSVAGDRLEATKGRLRMWIDPKTLLPLKRQFTDRTDAKNEDRETETYSEIVLDAPVDTKQFELPPGPEPRKLPPIRGGAPDKTGKDTSVLLDSFGDRIPGDATARLGTLRWRVAGRPWAISYSHDGKLLASISGDSNASCLAVFDAETGQRLSQFTAPTYCHTLAFSLDGKSLITESAIFDVATGEERKRYGGRPEYLASSTCSPDGTVMATMYDMGSKVKVILIDTGTGKELRRLEWRVAPNQDKKTEGVVRVSPPQPAFSADGKMLATSSADKTVRLWDVASGKEIKRLEGFEKTPHHVTFAPRGRLLVSSVTGENDLLMWDVEKGTVQRRLQTDEKVIRVLFSPDGKYLAWIGIGNGFRLCDAETGKELRRWQGVRATSVLAFSPDGQVLASAASEDSTIRRWDTNTGKEIDAALRPTGSINRLWFARDGKKLFSSSSDLSFQEWNLANNERGNTGPINPISEVDPFVYSSFLGISPDRKVAALYTMKFQMPQTPAIYLFDALTGKGLHVLKKESLTRYATFSPDSRLIAITGKEGVELWDVGSGKFQHKLPIIPVPGENHSMFSPDGTQIAVCSYRSLGLYDVATAKLIREWNHGVKFPGEIAFSPDGKLLAIADRSDKLVTVWLTGTGKLIRSLDFSAILAAELNFGAILAGEVAFSPSNRCLAAVTGETVQVWDIHVGQPICEIRATQGMVRSLAFSPDGRTLATGGDDSTILLWDLAHKAPAVKPLDDLWSDLGGDAVKADQAIWSLTLAAEKSVPFLKKRLKPAAPADAKKVDQLLTDLDSPQFAVRKKATEELEKLGESAEGQLRKFATGKTNLELRQRVEQILAKRDSDPELIRYVRTLEVLEHIATPEARQVLQDLAANVPNPRISEAATAAVSRMKLN